MTIRKLIEIFERQRKDNVVGRERITEYVNALETRLCDEVFLTHADPPPGVFVFLGREPGPPTPDRWPPFIPHPPGYSEEWTFDEYTEIPLLVKPPYDDIYRAYIQWQVDLEQNDVVDAGNSQRIWWQAYQDFSKYWNRTHMPVDRTPYRGYRE